MFVGFTSPVILKVKPHHEPVHNLRIIRWMAVIYGISVLSVYRKYCLSVH